MIPLFKAVKIFDEPQPLHSGGTSNVMFDILQLLPIPSDREALIKYVSESIPHADRGIPSTCLVGIEFGGVLIAALVAERMKMSMGILRKNEELIMPDDFNYMRCIIVDDVVTTGESMSHARDILTDKGHNVVAEICIVDRRELYGNKSMGQ